MIRMLIVGYVFAIRSERALCRDAQWASFLADFVPLALRDLIRFTRNAPARRPSISYPVSATRVTVNQHSEELFGVQPI